MFETARGTVHAWQCDHMGHANLRAYGEFFEQALWHVFNRIGMTPSVLRGEAIRMAGVQQNITYRREKRSAPRASLQRCAWTPAPESRVRFPARSPSAPCG
jgi:acyl-CoA thioesterase FadM